MIRSSTIVAICALVLAVSAWNIRPLRAGTIEIMDMDIRLGKSFTKNINL